MSTTCLKYIVLKGFRSFVKPTRINFPESGMSLIRGFNKDTNGSSGSGKSSIALGIAYALGYCPFPATVLQTWLSDEPLSVELGLQTAEGEAVIYRGSKLSLKVNGKLFKGGATAVESEIQRLVGLSPTLLEALTYRGQKKPGRFLSMPDSDKKEFLSKVLGLDRIEEAVEKAQKKISDLTHTAAFQETVVANEKARLDALRAELGPEPVPTDLSAQEAEYARLVTAEKENADRLSELRVAIAKIKTDAELAKREGEQVFEPKLAELRKRLNEVMAEKYKAPVTEELKRLQNLEAEVKLRLKKAMEADDYRRAEQRAEVANLNGKIRTAQQAADSVQRLKRDIAKAEKEISQLAENTCPTCQQFWLQALDHHQKLAEQVKLLQEKLTAAEGLAAELPELTQELEALNEFTPDPKIQKLLQAQAQVQTDLAVERQKSSIGEASFKAIQNQQLALIRQEIAQQECLLSEFKSGFVEQIEKELAPLNEELEARMFAGQELTRKKLATGSFIEVTKQSNEHDVRLWREQQKMIERQAEAYNTAAVNLHSTQVQLAKEQDFVKLIGREGFLGSIFDEVLAEISNETNKILASIPNTSHVTLQFKSESTTQKGTIKRAIVPVVNVGGHEAPLASGLSGGMGTSVELATDLAVGAVIARRSGCSPDWLILDEAFDGLGVIEKEAAMEIIRRFASNKLVLVIDHMNEFKERFTQFIDVEHENGQSQVR